MTRDIRWEQRFDNYLRALQNLSAAVSLAQSRTLTPLEEQGLIQSFEFTHELAWNVLKDYLDYQGIINIIGSRDATRGAFKAGIIHDGEVWMRMIQDRNLSTHTYDENTAKAIVSRIVANHAPVLQALADTMTTHLGEV